MASTPADDHASGPGPDRFIVFDCDGVLVDSEVLVADVEAELLTAAGYPHDSEEIIERYAGLSYDLMMEDVGRRFGRSVPEATRRHIESEALARLGRDLTPVPGIPELLDGLSVPCCVASSSRPDRIDLSLEAAGLGSYFPPNRRFSTDMVDQPKPAPDVFLLVAEQCGVPAEDCLVVEDSPSGVWAAIDAGMAVAGFLGGGHARPALRDRLEQAGARVILDDTDELARFLALG